MIFSAYKAVQYVSTRDLQAAPLSTKRKLHIDAQALSSTEDLCFYLKPYKLGTFYETSSTNIAT